MGSLLLFDEDGDAQIDFHGIEEITWVYKDKLAKLRKQVTWTSAVARAEIAEVSCALKKLEDDLTGTNTRLEKIFSDPQGKKRLEESAAQVQRDILETGKLLEKWEMHRQ